MINDQLFILMLVQDMNNYPDNHSKWLVIVPGQVKPIKTSQHELG